MENKGKFIVLEGIDGAGKTTQLDLLEAHFQKEGIPVFRTAEPTDSEVGRYIRRALSGEIFKTPVELALLFSLDRVEHCQRIKEKLDAGVTVLCDRYDYSTLAYQGFATDFEWVKSLCLDCPEILVPDLCIFLDLSPEESMERIRRRGEHPEIFETEEKLTKIRNQFLTALSALPRNVQILNANTTPENLHEKILSLL